MYKKIVALLRFICVVLVAWGFGYFICVVAAPVGSAYIAGGLQLTDAASKLDLLVFLGASYLCYAAFLVIAEVLLVKWVNDKLKSFIERVFERQESDKADGSSERKVFKKRSKKFAGK